MNCAFDILQSLKFLNWESLLVGFEKGYIDTLHIRRYAADSLETGDYKNADEYTLSLLATSHDKEEMNDLIKNLISKKNINYDLEKNKWRLAFLKILDLNDIPAEEKIIKLQTLYEDFDYPEDMYSCSIYSQDSQDPLASMQNVIKKLENDIKEHME